MLDIKESLDIININYMNLINLSKGKQHTNFNTFNHKRWVSVESLEKMLIGLTRIGGDHRAGAYNKALRDIHKQLKEGT